ncbi:S1 RNA-binding domain-containing protein [Mediterraneibacter glycyrrhizinilyticus]|uniref:S1 RNA-binding domain-containing protein n=1 Tax=Candidatus Mediterraneibacter faecipullorum TaxID=2838670 RepID=A0A9D2NMB5_9FIRM|nr:S1-like domain-containing RNA-binding protein [Mediterraneibacter glycyrrhizinilyticus]MDM8126208.1 S1-like domain-containing RNA-binding protein [Mediterraneibacter glycyrrhizinilyticus]HJC34357.1 S1 RNA-binding domain-containing protein [Candidatus Mediterraneibacter faecipullorum]
MRLGEKQVLTVVKKVDFGVYLGSDEERVLLPKKQVPEEIEVGDPVEVFLYKDSSDRMIATTKEPKLTLGNLAVLEVVDVGRIGAFLDWGLEKDLLLPFKEQTTKVEKGDRCLVSLYIDKSGRLCATMKVYPLLRTDSPYKKDDTVRGTVYEISRDFGVFVAVDDRFSALIPRREVYGRMYIGQQIEARVAAVKADGKLDLSVRGRIPEQMDADAQKIMDRIEKSGGGLPFTDKADPERIRDEFGMSKAAFKRAVGRLLKQGKVRIDEKQEKIVTVQPAPFAKTH